MRIRASNRLALLTAAAVLTAAGIAHVPVTPTYASRPSSATAQTVQRGNAGTSASLSASAPSTLTAGMFHEVALPGFGDPANSWAWSMAWFKGKLYVGTNRNYTCVSSALWYLLLPPGSSPYPPNDPNVQCPSSGPGITPTVQDLPPTLGAQIWAVDPNVVTPTTSLTQADWTNVYSSSISVPMTVAGHVVMGPRDMAFRGMTVYTERDGQQALYISGVGMKPLAGPKAPPPSLLRTTDGVHFQAVPADPGTTMGSINTKPDIVGVSGQADGCCMRGSVSYNGKFYILIGDIQGGGTVFVSSDPRLGDNSFQRFTPLGMQVFELQPFNGHLYLGVQSYSGGYTVMQTDANCALPCPASDFTTVVPPGGGLGNQGNFGITSMHVFTDSASVPHLYVGTDGATNNMAAEIVRVNLDGSWDLVVGQPRQATQVINGVTTTVMMTPTSGLNNGFNWPWNYHMWRMADYNGVLYVGTFDASTTVRNYLPAQYQHLLGFDLWATSDGTTFTPVTLNGFGDPLCVGARTLVSTPYGLFVGCVNLYRALRVWLGSLPPSSLRAAPHNVQVDQTASGATALAWTAPAGTTIFHVYRSTVSPQRLPALSQPDPVADVLPHAYVRARPQTVMVPGTYSEIGTTTNSYYVDRTTSARGTYNYYVVAQDAHGHLSIPSSIASNQNLLPAPTFSSIGKVLKSLMARGNVTRSPALERALHAAYARLGTAYARWQAGDTQSSRAVLAALRRSLRSAFQGPAGRQYAEDLDNLLSRLETRMTLVHAHILVPRRLQ